MPCNSDYMQQTPREHRLQLTSQLLFFVTTRLVTEFGVGSTISGDALSQATVYYAKDMGQVEELCRVLTEMSPEHREAIVYDAHDVMSRELAHWWEEHQEADRKREAKEAQEKVDVNLRASALAKLTDEEKKALGL